MFGRLGAMLSYLEASEVKFDIHVMVQIGRSFTCSASDFDLPPTPLHQHKLYFFRTDIDLTPPQWRISGFPKA